MLSKWASCGVKGWISAGCLNIISPATFQYFMHLHIAYLERVVMLDPEELLTSSCGQRLHQHVWRIKYKPDLGTLSSIAFIGIPTFALLFGLLRYLQTEHAWPHSCSHMRVRCRLVSRDSTWYSICLELS
jgi:hypothetical protein